MTRKKRRIMIVSAAGVLLAIATVLVLTAFQQDIIYFYGPSDLKEKQVSGELPEGRALRLGGLVEDDSVIKEDGTTRTIFRVTDGSESFTVSYDGILPDLFREGQGVVTEGILNHQTGVFQATEVLAKHDETYMPPEVMEALEKAGYKYEEGKGHNAASGDGEAKAY
ncbi:cytochrome c maturation protein CcmE [Kiloniella sp. b19]|uniref:cytochrome c maturation protein CcmE n=1 Tax=Kiloniella sp. GXU_MW_B19 TaxID=3141326 RepID=UPI0031DEEA2F